MLGRLGLRSAEKLHQMIRMMHHLQRHPSNETFHHTGLPITKAERRTDNF